MGRDVSVKLVGLLTGQNPQVLLGMLGILKSGNAFVPLDPKHPDDRLSFVIADCSVEILVTEARYLEKARALADRSPTLQHIICLDPAEALPHAQAQVHVLDALDVPATKTDVRVDADQIAYVIYTSGSTGTPKGVLISHRNVVPLLRWSQTCFKFGSHTRVLQTLNPCFDFGVFELLTAVLFGGTLHFLDQDARDDLARYTEYINAQKINTINATPAFFKGLLSLSDALPSLEVVHLGGEALTPELVRSVYAVTSERCAVFNGYGPTEATINCAILPVGTQSESHIPSTPTIPIGKASANNRLYVLDSHMHPVPIGVPGELYVGGPALSSGYLHRPALTAERFVPDPFGPSSGGRLYRSGDLVRYNGAGDIEFLGRIDHQVKIRGFRIELGEIETALSNQPGVKESIVLAVEDEHGEKRLVAYFVAAGVTPDSAALKKVLNETLPSYMLPDAFVALEAWPLTRNGKIDRRALPAPDLTAVVQAYVAPRTPVEEALAAVWAQVLHREQVGIQDNFFELGGHSLLATQVISRIRKDMKVVLPLSVLFDQPTVEALALIVEERQQSSEKTISIGRAARRKPKTSAPSVALEQLSDEDIAALLSDMLAQKRGE